MKTFVNISFRFPAAVVKRHLPSSLETVLRGVKDLRPSGMYDPGWSACCAEVGAAMIDEIVEWGQQWVEPGDEGGEAGTLIRVVNIEEHYGVEDLQDTALVQVLPPLETEDEPPVRNWKSVFRAWWDCPHCNRISFEQTGALQVRPSRRMDSDLTDTRHWLLAREAAPALAGCDVTLRELQNTESHFQVEPRRRCRMRLDDPAFELGPPCEGCGQPQWIIPNSVWTGTRLPGPGISVFREPILCVEADYDPEAGVYQSDIGWGRFEQLPGERPHAAGEPFPSRNYLLATKMPRGFTLVAAEVMERLLRRNLRGLAFRPVRIGSGGP